MTPEPSPGLSRPALLRFLATAAVALLLAHLADRWAYAHLYDPHFQDTDLGRMLRVMGFLPLWMAAALALALCDRPLRATRSAYEAASRGLLLFASSTVGGIAAELLKLVFRRERPRAHAGAYVFRAWSEHPLSTGGLSFPSSHALVAFGAVAMLALLFPRARWVWYALGAGCAFARVAAGAHFLSDVTASAVAGVLIAEGLWRLHLRRLARALPPSPGPEGVACAAPRSSPL